MSSSGPRRPTGSPGRWTSLRLTLLAVIALVVAESTLAYLFSTTLAYGAREGHHLGPNGYVLAVAVLIVASTALYSGFLVLALALFRLCAEIALRLPPAPLRASPGLLAVAGFALAGGAGVACAARPLSGSPLDAPSMLVAGGLGAVVGALYGFAVGRGVRDHGRVRWFPGMRSFGRHAR